MDGEEIHVARSLLGWAGEAGGYSPGGFTACLFTAFARADDVNFARLASAYPIHGQMMWTFKYDPAGLAALRELASATVV